MEPHRQSLKRLVFETLAEIGLGATVISERNLSRSFLGFWAELLPLLTPSFVHMFNEMYKSHLIDDKGALARKVEKVSGISDSAFVAEVAFYIAKLAAQKGASAVSACEDRTLAASATHLAAATVAAYEGDANRLPDDLTIAEYGEVLNLARNYDIFFREHSEIEAVTFNPLIRGAGFISSCEADIAIGSILYEVKTVTRNIASKDIRQLVIYLALQAATGERRWPTAGFFNPRRAVVHKFSVDDFISRMSGGRFSMDVFQDIINFAATREIDIDTIF